MVEIFGHRCRVNLIFFFLCLGQIEERTDNAQYFFFDNSVIPLRYNFINSKLRAIQASKFRINEKRAHLSQLEYEITSFGYLKGASDTQVLNNITNRNANTAILHFGHCDVWLGAFEAPHLNDAIRKPGSFDV